jgi:hypothetical protein
LLEANKMSSVAEPYVSDLLLTAKSREVQRGSAAEAQGESDEAARHFLAAAHLELVLAEDYRRSEQTVLAVRSLMSAASCFWRAGEIDRAKTLFQETAEAFPSFAADVDAIMADLAT